MIFREHRKSMLGCSFLSFWINTRATAGTTSFKFRYFPFYDRQGRVKYFCQDQRRHFYSNQNIRSYFLFTILS